MKIGDGSFRWEKKQARRSLLDGSQAVERYSLQLSHLFYGVARTFFANTTTLEATVWHQISSPKWGPVNHGIPTLNLLSEA